MQLLSPQTLAKLCLQAKISRAFSLCCAEIFFFLHSQDGSSLLWTVNFWMPYETFGKLKDGVVEYVCEHAKCSWLRIWRPRAACMSLWMCRSVCNVFLATAILRIDDPQKKAHWPWSYFAVGDCRSIVGKSSHGKLYFDFSSYKMCPTVEHKIVHIAIFF